MENKPEPTPAALKVPHGRRGARQWWGDHAGLPGSRAGGEESMAGIKRKQQREFGLSRLRELQPCRSAQSPLCTPTNWQLFACSFSTASAVTW